MAIDVLESTQQRESPASPIAGYLGALLERHAGNRTGEVATYIPELAQADPDLFGICVATVDGALYQAGDTDVPFTIQSMSKPLTYGLALELAGEDAVRRRVGVEPSGDPFNEISLRAATGTPVNPMINAGAIACAGMVAELAPDPLETLLSVYSKYAARRLTVDEAVYRSEAGTGHRNRAIAHLLRGHEVLEGDAESALDLYYRQCAVSVDCRDLALIAATLANGGVNPLTEERAVGADAVRCLLSVMTSCGMYDGAGEWLVSVGIPAKSGVSGGVLGVLPGRLGVAVFSPRLDEQGNSVRGVAVCRDLSHDLGLHLIRPGERTAGPVRAAYMLGERNSKRRRSPEERAAIASAAGRTAIFELQGDFDFMAAEAVSRGLLDRDEPAELVVVDLRLVKRADPAGTEFLGSLASALEAGDGELVVSGAGDSPNGVRRFGRLDEALEWCENELLARVGHDEARAVIAIESHPLLAGLDDSELALVVARLDFLDALPGEIVVRHGDPANELFLVTEGELSVYVPGAIASGHRLTTLGPGMTFGELAYLDRRPRSADVVADGPVACRTLPFALLDDLAENEPTLCAKLLRNVLAVVTASLHLANSELRHFAA
jgi:glutaminase